MIQTAYIIGGGGSLKGFDFSPIRGAETYAVNRSAEVVKADILVSIDRSFCQHFGALIASYGARAHIAPVDFSNADQYPNATFYARNKARTLFDHDREALPGLNSGFAALALAIRRGHTRIGLLGFDGTSAGHFHSGYGWASSPDSVVDIWVQDFERGAEDCRTKGIEVINFSINSRIQGFQKRNLEDLFQ